MQNYNEPNPPSNIHADRELVVVGIAKGLKEPYEKREVHSVAWARG
jgi:hypothetical protein